MARPPVGTVRQPLSDTALFAHIASRLQHVGVKDLETWARELGVAVGPYAIRNAQHTAQRLATPTDRARALRPWAYIDYAALDFFMAVATLETSGNRSTGLKGLENVRGVVDLLCVERSARVLALVIFERRSDKTTLETALGEWANIVEWSEIEEQRPMAAIATFRALARRSADSEHLRA